MFLVSVTHLFLLSSPGPCSSFNDPDCVNIFLPHESQNTLKFSFYLHTSVVFHKCIDVSILGLYFQCSVLNFSFPILLDFSLSLLPSVIHVNYLGYLSFYISLHVYVIVYEYLYIYTNILQGPHFCFIRMKSYFTDFSLSCFSHAVITHGMREDTLPLMPTSHGWNS